MFYLDLLSLSITLLHKLKEEDRRSLNFTDLSLVRLPMTAVNGSVSSILGKTLSMMQNSNKQSSLT